jgi:hypothetical protein
MDIQEIDIGTPGTETGDKVRDAFDKVNDNFEVVVNLFGVDILELRRSVEWYSKTQITIKSGAYLIGTSWFYLASDTVYAIADILDTGSISNGKDYYVYACNNSGVLTFKVSLASTFPAGYDANSSRKIGGFHTLCVSVGTISGHTLTGYVANDILPASVWDLKHRPVSEPAGMVYVDAIDKWVDIYLPSGTGASTLSVYGGTISDTRNWMNFVDDGAAVLKRLMRDAEFQIVMAQSNEGTNIASGADPVTTGGHSDTAARRMISKYGIEDGCGAMWQWLLDQSYRFDAATNHTHQVTVSGDPETVTSGNPSVDVAPAWSYKDQTGGKGNLNTQGIYGDVKLLGGGNWNRDTRCGSRGRSADNYRWYTATGISGRFLSEPKK